MRLAAVATNAPAIRKDVRIEQVGSCHLRPVVERGAEQTIDQLCPGEFVRPNRLESAAIQIGSTASAGIVIIFSAAAVGCAEGVRRSMIGSARIYALTHW